MWQKALRDRLCVLRAEIEALDDMRALLGAAEEVVFGIHELRNFGSGSPLITMAVGGDKDSSGKRTSGHGSMASDFEKVAVAGGLVCDMLGNSDGSRAIDDIYQVP